MGELARLGPQVAMRSQGFEIRPGERPAAPEVGQLLAPPPLGGEWQATIGSASA